MSVLEKVLASIANDPNNEAYHDVSRSKLVGKWVNKADNAIDVSQECLQLLKVAGFEARTHTPGKEGERLVFNATSRVSIARLRAIYQRMFAADAAGRQQSPGQVAIKNNKNNKNNKNSNSNSNNGSKKRKSRKRRRKRSSSRHRSRHRRRKRSSSSKHRK